MTAMAEHNSDVTHHALGIVRAWHCAARRVSLIGEDEEHGVAMDASKELPHPSVDNIFDTMCKRGKRGEGRRNSQHVHVMFFCQVTS